MSKLPTLTAWINRESDQANWVGIGGRDQEMMLAYWEANRPKMFKLLKSHNLHRKFAQIREEKAMQQLDRTMRQMPSTDAQEQAERDWYLMEPEEPESDPETELLGVIHRETTV